MYTIIAGSRDITDIRLLFKAIAKFGFTITKVISGGARGVDKLGEQWGKKNNISIKTYPANWDKFGKLAGYKRNIEMSENAEALIAIWDGESKGTKHMIDIAIQKGLKVYIYKIGE